MKDELPRCKTTNYRSPKKGELMLYSRHRRGRAVAFPQQNRAPRAILHRPQAAASTSKLKKQRKTQVQESQHLNKVLMGSNLLFYLNRRRGRSWRRRGAGNRTEQFRDRRPETSPHQTRVPVPWCGGRSACSHSDSATATPTGRESSPPKCSARCEPQDGTIMSAGREREQRHGGSPVTS